MRGLLRLRHSRHASDVHVGIRVLGPQCATTNTRFHIPQPDRLIVVAAHERRCLHDPIRSGRVKRAGQAELSVAGRQPARIRVGRDRGLSIKFLARVD